jgi:hypothetical protein
MLFVESLMLASKCSDKLAITTRLEHLAGVAAAQEQIARAVQLWGIATALRETIGAPLWPVDRPDYQHCVAVARTQIDISSFVTMWAAGKAMPLDQAIAYALVNPVSATDGSPVPSMNTTDVPGLSSTQTATLKAMGTVEEHG